MNNLLSAACAALIFACSAAAAEGPTGLGDLKLGMTKDQVEAISLESSAHLNSPLVPFEDKAPKAHEQRSLYQTTIKSPIDPNPLRASFVFTEGQLSAIHVYFDYDSQMLENAKEMIMSKYGDPKVADTMKEEQCILRNGANFKLKSGKLSYSWSESSPELGYVETTLLEDVMNSCTLTKYAGGAIKSKKLSIIRSAQEPEKQENPF